MWLIHSVSRFKSTKKVLDGDVRIWRPTLIHRKKEIKEKGQFKVRRENFVYGAGSVIAAQRSELKSTPLSSSEVG